MSAVSATNAADTAFFVVANGSRGGFLVLSADDRLDPVLVIAPTGRFDATPGAPLYDMLCGDVRGRVAAAETTGAAPSQGWSALLADDVFGVAAAFSDVSTIDDVRVAPLVQSAWGQSTVGGQNVFNSCTPNNYVCGCVATAGAQIMRYHRHPQEAVAPVTRTCYVDGAKTSRTMFGGVYDWDAMPLVPTSAIGAASRAAIGTLCYDLGVALMMSWASDGSGTGGYCLKDAFLDVFGYANAMAVQLSGGSSLSDEALENALLANFDAGCPVELSIRGKYGGHSVVGDGYGYSGGSLYVHLNLGWDGGDDAWYHLPDIGTVYSFDVVNGAVYNIFPEGTGDLLTGRVLDASTGRPIAGATVQARDGEAVAGTATTSATGVYALRLPGGRTYDVVARAAGKAAATQSVALRASVTTTTSGRYFVVNTGTVGNSWGNDFALAAAAGASARPVDWGGGVSWPVVDNGDGTATTNALVFAGLADGRLAFSGVSGRMGAKTTVHVRVKTSLASDAVYTVAAALEIVAPGTAVLDLRAFWGTYPSLFVIGLADEQGRALP